MLQGQGFADVGGGLLVKDGSKLSIEISDWCERCHGLGKILSDGAFVYFTDREELRSCSFDVTAVARKRSRPFCQKSKWQVTAEHACTLRYVALHEVT